MMHGRSRDVPGRPVAGRLTPGLVGFEANAHTRDQAPSLLRRNLETGLVHAYALVLRRTE